MDGFHFVRRIAIFGKTTKAIVHGFVKKWGFGGIEPFYVRMYVYMSSNYCTQQKLEPRPLYLSSKRMDLYAICFE